LLLLTELFLISLGPDIASAATRGIGLESGFSSEFRVFQLSELQFATNKFSDENRLGQGGFGSVYKVEQY
jgi:hypothetical protein